MMVRCLLKDWGVASYVGLVRFSTVARFLCVFTFVMILGYHFSRLAAELAVNSFKVVVLWSDLCVTCSCLDSKALNDLLLKFDR